MGVFLERSLKAPNNKIQPDMCYDCSIEDPAPEADDSPAWNETILRLSAVEVDPRIITSTSLAASLSAWEGEPLVTAEVDVSSERFRSDVPGVIDLAPLGAVIVAAVEIEIKTVITAISLATTPRIAPLDPFALTVGLRTINLGTAHRKKWINRLRHHHHTNLALTPAELPMIPPDLNISLLTLMQTQHL